MHTLFFGGLPKSLNSDFDMEDVSRSQKVLSMSCHVLFC